MRAIEVTGTVDEQGNLSLDQPIPKVAHGQVRIIVLYPEPAEEQVDDPDNISTEEVKASLRRSLQQVKSGQRLPLSQMWEGIDEQ